MKKRWLLYTIFGLLFYLIFLIVEMPAAWFAWGLNHYTKGTIRLDPISGSLWNGNGKVVIYYPPTTPHDLGIIEWNINPFWLFTGRIQTHWKAAAKDNGVDTTIRLGLGEAQLIDTDISLPAESISAFYSPAALIAPQGQVRLRSAKLSIDKNNLDGVAEILWQNAGSSLSNVQPLGDYRLEIVGGGKTADLKLTTSRGALELNGQGKWQLHEGQLQINGTAVPREQASELEPVLKLLGSDQGNGRRTFIMNTHLSIN